MNKTLILLVGGDLAAALLAHGLGLSFRTATAVAGDKLPLLEPLRLASFVSVVVFSAFLAELYNRGKSFGSRDLLIRIAAALVLAATLLSMAELFLHRDLAQWPAIAVSLAAFSLLQFAWHRSSHHLLRLPGVAEKVLILGGGPVADQIEKIIAASDYNYVLAGHVHPDNGQDVSPAPAAASASADTLAHTAMQGKVDKIVISLTERRGVLPVRAILGCKLSGIEIVDAMSFYEQVTGKLMVEKITPSWFIFSNGSRVTPFMRFYKRVFDVLFGTIGIILIAPLLPLIALAVKLDSPGPVMFRQVRVGMGEKNFTLYKFRTMHADAERQTGAVWASENDPRVTRTGRFLRKTRLDEIPQLLNVLKGDMSLVGPRPERPEFVAKLKEVIPFYSNRHYVKPGATGWAQVNYSYGASTEDAIEKLRYDLYYIKNYSLMLDFLIILETVKVVLFGRGAR